MDLMSTFCESSRRNRGRRASAAGVLASCRPLPSRMNAFFSVLSGSSEEMKRGLAEQEIEMLNLVESLQRVVGVNGEVGGDDRSREPLADLGLEKVRDEAAPVVVPDTCVWWWRWHFLKTVYASRFPKARRNHSRLRVKSRSPSPRTRGTFSSIPFLNASSSAMPQMNETILLCVALVHVNCQASPFLCI